MTDDLEFIKTLRKDCKLKIDLLQKKKETFLTKTDILLREYNKQFNLLEKYISNKRGGLGDR